MKVNENSEKASLKLNIQKEKMKIMASGNIGSWQIDGETRETVREFIFLGCSPSYFVKSLWMVTAALK